MLNLRSDILCICSHKEKNHGLFIEDDPCYKVLQIFPELIWCDCKKFTPAKIKEMQ